MKYLLFIGFSVTVTLLGTGCHLSARVDAQEGARVSVTPVTVTHPDTAVITETISLSAVATYLLRTEVKANITGYIIRCSVQAASRIRAGQTLFVLETKEARSLGNTINQLDSTFRFSGRTVIRSPAAGYITMLGHQAGDYIQDGEVLAGVADENSFGFMLDLPYEDHRLLSPDQHLEVRLPDGTELDGYAAKTMPGVDSALQTQKIWIKVPAGHPVPENLIAEVSLKVKRSTHLCLQKEAVLTDENQQDFWVMKLINDSIAVRVPIRKGVETDSMTEIVAPDFDLRDRLVLQGGYGLADTAKVSVQK